MKHKGSHVIWVWSTDHQWPRPCFHSGGFVEGCSSSTAPLTLCHLSAVDCLQTQQTPTHARSKTQLPIAKRQKQSQHALQNELHVFWNLLCGSETDCQKTRGAVTCLLIHSWSFHRGDPRLLLLSYQTWALLQLKTTKTHTYTYHFIFVLFHMYWWLYVRLCHVWNRPNLHTEAV